MIMSMGLKVTRFHLASLVLGLFDLEVIQIDVILFLSALYCLASLYGCLFKRIRGLFACLKQPVTFLFFF